MWPSGSSRGPGVAPADDDARVRAALTLCARPSPDQLGDDRLSHYLAGLTDWPAFALAAESHGLGPLVYSHLEAAGPGVPLAARRAFQGLCLRHGRQNELRLRALREILIAFEAAGVSALVLKGAALANLIYARPGLRPMGDLDLLVRRRDLDGARQVLRYLDFVTAGTDGDSLPDKHDLLTKDVKGLRVRVELHHRLFPEKIERPTVLDVRSRSLVPFTLDGLTAHTLDADSLLCHLCQHLVFHADVFTRLRLIWIADIARLAESFLDRIDWEHVSHDFPIAHDVLSLIDAIIPLSERLHAAARLPAVLSRSDGWADFRGWPRSSVGHQRRQGKDSRIILLDTFLPSPWWLRLHYGLSRTSPLGWHRWVRHPLEIVGWTTQLARQRVASGSRSTFS